MEPLVGVKLNPGTLGVVLAHMNQATSYQVSQDKVRINRYVLLHSLVPQA
jgi:hypothetical protein